MELARLIEALSDPHAYPYPVREVEIRQTHISVVFLAGSYAYKVKKPVHLSFVDFTTLDKRRHFCAEEVRLNRRLAPDVYIGAVPVKQSDRRLKFEGEGEIVEWAVKMVRLPEEATVRERLRRGELSQELVEALATRIALFHGLAESNPASAALGRFEPVARNLRDIFEQSQPQVGTTVGQGVFDRLKALTEEALAQMHDLIEARSKRGVTRDTHGDLHLDHIYYFSDRPAPGDWVIVDCIEFNERFRFIDPVADMAFAAMDFALYGRRDLAGAFALAYFHASGDAEGWALLPLYKAYRAMVRGCVEGLKLAEPEIGAADRAATLDKSRAHWLVALGELESPNRKPCLLLIGGLPGTGKSSLAKALAAQAGFFVVRSDVVRKELAGIPIEERTLPGQERVYSAEWTEQTYAECLRQAKGMLWEGKRVIVDATFREEQRRRTFLDAAISCGVPGAMLLCRADPEIVRLRLQNRRNDASDAEWATYLRLTEQWEEIGLSTLQSVRELSADGTPEKILSQAMGVLREMGLVG